MRKVLLILVCQLLIMAAASPAPALEPAGPEFQANTFTLCNQANPDADGLVGGGFVVVWQSGSYEYPQDGSYPGVFGQRFDDTGARMGTEFEINAYTTNEQTRPEVARQAGGGFVVVWQSWEQDGSGYAIVGRRMNANGIPVAGEFIVNDETRYGQYVPKIAAHESGFVVVWASDYQDGDGSSVYGQRFGASGAKVGPEFRVSTATLNNQDYPDVAARADGRFIVVWHSGESGSSTTQDGSGFGIFGQRFTSDGAPDGMEFPINVYATGNQVRPQVAYGPDGGFLVVWESHGLVGEPSTTDEVVGRKFQPDATPAGTEFRVNTLAYNHQEDAAIAASPSGEFLVSWTSGFQDGSGTGIFARHLNADGTPVGSVRRINTTAGPDEFQVNTTTTDDQTDSRIAALENGGFAVVWESDEQDGTQDGAFGQSYQPRGPMCGDANGDGNVTATDALQALKTAVGAASCIPCACDVDSSGMTAASDALRILRAAVGQLVELICAPC